MHKPWCDILYKYFDRRVFLPENLAEGAIPDSVVCYAHRGSEQAPEKLYVQVGTHGNEIASPLGAIEVLKEEWRWPNVQAIFVMQDVAGYNDEGYGFVGIDGNESCWPPLWAYRQNQERYWGYYDENSTWGNTAVIPARHQLMRKLMDDFEPTFTLSLHETIRQEGIGWIDPFWGGSGILAIEVWPMSPGEFGKTVNLEGSPLANPLGWLFEVIYEFIRPSLRIPRWKRAVKALRGNKHYQLTTSIAERYKEIGGKMSSQKWTDYHEYFHEPVIGEGRLLHDVDMMWSEWRTCTDYACAHHRCPAITTETFPPAEVGLRGVDDRVEQQKLFVMATLDVLEAKEVNVEEV